MTESQLKLVRLPLPLAATLAALPSISEIPFLDSWFSDLLVLVKQFYGDQWWMRLRRDAIRGEKSASCVGRLSLRRLPAKCGCALCAVGSGAAQRCGRDKGRTAQDSVRESDSFLCSVLRHAFVFRRQQRFRHNRFHDCVARRSDTICAAESDLPRR